MGEHVDGACGCHTPQVAPFETRTSPSSWHSKFANTSSLPGCHIVAGSSTRDSPNADRASCAASPSHSPPPPQILIARRTTMPPKNPKHDLKYLLGPSDGATGSSAAASSGSSRNSPERCTCPLCGHRFTQSGDMHKHMRTVHQGLRPYSCEICGRSFGENGNLQKHKRSVHFNERPFQCAECGSTFAFKSGLTRHQKLVHENAYPFGCPCGQRFKQKFQLKKHAKTCSKAIC